MTKLLTIDQVAEIYQVSPRTVRNWIDQGIISPVRLGPKLLRIEESELYRFIG